MTFAAGGTVALLIQVAAWGWGMHKRTKVLNEIFGRRYEDLSPPEKAATDRAMAYHYLTSTFP